MKELAAIRKIFSSLIEHRMAKKSRVSNSFICSIFFLGQKIASFKRFDCFHSGMTLFFSLLNYSLRNSLFKSVFNYFRFRLNLCQPKCFTLPFFSSLHSAHNDSVCFLLVENEFFSHAIKVFPLLLKRFLLSLFFVLAWFLARICHSDLVHRPLTNTLLTIIKNWCIVKWSSFSFYVYYRLMQPMINAPLHE